MNFQGFLTPFLAAFWFHVFPYPEWLCLSFSIIRKLSNIIRYTKFFTVNTLNGLGLWWNVCSLEGPNDSEMGVSWNDQCIFGKRAPEISICLTALDKAMASLKCWGKRNDNMLLRRSTAKRQIQKKSVPVSTSLLPMHQCRVSVSTNAIGNDMEDKAGLDTCTGGGDGLAVGKLVSKAVSDWNWDLWIKSRTAEKGSCDCRKHSA